MAEFYPVAPVHILQELAESRLIQNGVLLEAHKVVEKPEEHTKFVKTFQGRVVILDNGAGILGKPADLNMVRVATEIIHSAGYKHIVVVLPDVYESSEETVDSIESSIEKWYAEITVPYAAEFMLVPQGKNERDFLMCAERLLYGRTINRCVRWWGVPRNVTNNMGSRVRAIKLLRTLRSNWTLHMLGFSDNIADDILCAQYKHVNSIDSSVPFRAARQGKLLTLYEEREHAEDWWDMKWTPEITTNIHLVRRWIMEA